MPPALARRDELTPAVVIHPFGKMSPPPGPLPRTGSISGGAAPSFGLPSILNPSIVVL